MSPARLAPRSLPALLFAGSAVVTLHWSQSMSGMGAIPLPGGASLSGMWAPMCGQTWAGAAATFTGMWSVMMMAMMLPSLAPMLGRYRQALASADMHSKTPQRKLAALTALAGAGYLGVWTVTGLIIFCLGAAIAEAAQQSQMVARSLPVATGLVLLLGGVFQFTGWKAHYLACCRGECATDIAGRSRTDAGNAWRYGTGLGRHCVSACAGLTLILLVMGVMNLGPMVLVTAAITAERLAPDGARIGRMVGAAAILAGLLAGALAVWHP